MADTDDIVDVYRQFICSGLVEHNSDRLLSILDEQVMGIGMGEQGFVSSAAECQEILTAYAKENTGNVYTAVFPKTEIRMLSPDVAALCGIVHITCMKGPIMSKSGLMQSLTLRRTADGWRICSLHASPIILSVESIEAYPMKYAENTLARLKADVEQTSQALLSEHLAGGVMAVRPEGSGFLPDFINAGMLGYLGYDREEFEQQFSNDILPIVYEADRDHFLQTLRDTLENGKDYETRLRMNKKDGSPLWMLARGRLTRKDEGHGLLVNLFVDISTMVNMERELREQAKNIALSEERFRIALEKTTSVIFECDLLEHSIRYCNGMREDAGLLTTINDVQHTFICGSTIYNDSMTDLFAAFGEIRKGTRQVQCVVRAQSDGGKDSWHRVSLTGIPDFEGAITRAVGMLEDITAQKEAEQAYAREEQFRQAIMADSLGMYSINFTRDLFESCQLNSPICLYAAPNEPYDSFIRTSVPICIHEAHQHAFLETFCRANVMEAFSLGKRELSLEYQGLHGDGTPIWVLNTLRMLLDAETNELKGYLYLTDIDRQKREALELQRSSQRDSLTDVYNKRTASILVNERLISSDAQETGIFLVLDVDHFKAVNDTFGHPFGDEVLICTAQILLENFRDTDIVGRLGGDEFCVFFCGMRSRKNLETAMERICEAMHSLHFPKAAGLQLSCSIGVAMCNGQPKNFDELYAQADRALYTAKQKGRDGFVILN